MVHRKLCRSGVSGLLIVASLVLAMSVVAIAFAVPREARKRTASVSKAAKTSEKTEAEKSSRTTGKTDKSSKPFSTGLTGAAKPLVDFVNTQIRRGWEDNEVQPSRVADDAEWLRRLYLDMVGHIPPGEVAEAFRKDRDKAKRSKMIDQLLGDPDYGRNWTTIWTNLCIGRRTPRRVNRAGMQKFFREAFARNRPWNEVVYDLVTAEGRFDRNGAVNYLLAQMTMRDKGVQATAKTTRLFMGVQVQCTQCHNHPFNNWKQIQFWQFNSFFRQARRVNHRKYDPKSGRRVDDYSEIVFRSFDGPVYFEKRSGLMQVAYPQFFGKRVDPGPEVNRRKALAQLMLEGDEPLVAREAVNRMWSHFFGYGFTRPIDDMGPHNPASHPELLDRLTNEFVKSKYDLKQLIRWITNTEAYNLTSRFGLKNTVDNPTAGETPLFSHLYVRSMQAEQLYDSLIIATDAQRAGRSDRVAAERQRQRWMQQFIITFGTDENDETTTFNGTISQALMMMNSPLIQNAVSAKKGSFLNRVLSARGPDVKRIRRLYLATLSRHPTRREQVAAFRLIHSRPRAARLMAYQDLFWALLNSNEFILNH